MPRQANFDKGNAALMAALESKTRPAIVVHGGAGSQPFTPERAEAARRGVANAARAGFSVLQAGGNALDAAVAAVVALEDDPSFNAGTGACLTSAGDVECDASLMDGRDLSAGAVAVVKTVKNPVLLARMVMQRTPHLLLAAEAADAFARECGVPAIERGALITDVQRDRWLALRAEAEHRGADEVRRGFGTVGAVCVDAHGHVAAATSTGGTPYKRPGRVGDTPIIGAGTFADDRRAAASATGLGEAIVRVGLARTACDLIGAGRSPSEATQIAIDEMSSRVQGDGGIIVAAPDGRVGWGFNTPTMARAMLRTGMSEAAVEL